MKLLKLFLITWSLSVQAGLPPATLSGQSAATAPTTFTFKTPYNQATSLGGVQTLIETGDENMLVDPGMEAPGVTAWTCTSGTCTKTTTAGEFTSGTRALKVALSAQALNVSQSVSTTSGIQTQGVVGSAYKIPTAMTDFQVCSTVAGAEQTCVPSTSLINDNLYHSIEIPVTMTAGSTVGIKFKTTATYTQNVFFDAAYVKQGIGYQNLMRDYSYSAVLSSTGVVSNENTDWINGNCTNASPSVCTFNSGIFTVAPTCLVVAGATLRYSSVTATSSSSVSVNMTNSGGGTGIDNTQYLFCQKSGNDYLAASSAVYSQANANYDWTSYTATFTGLGTVSPASNMCKHRRVGGDLEVNCSVTTGTVTATLFSITLPSGLTLDSSRIIAANTTASPGQIFGTYTQPNTNSYGSVVSATGTSTSLLYVGNVIASGGQLTPVNAASPFNSSTLTNIYFKVPISGWSNSAQIVGSFAGYPNVPGYQGNVDTFSVSYGGASVTTVCSSTPCTLYNQIGSGFSSISWGSTGSMTLNFSKTYTKINCTGNVRTSAAPEPFLVPLTGSSTSTLALVTTVVSSGAGVNTYGTLDCKGTY